jgi:GNAT superfamily N-acetyltransferase
VPQSSQSTSFQITGPHFGQSAVVNEILRALPDWFGIEESIVNYVKEVDALPAFLAREENSNRVAGFISIRQHFEHAAEVHLIAVHAEHHRAGLGRDLLRAAEQWLRSRGMKFLQVKTLSPARECAHYERTRKFYEAMGFVPLEEFPTLWGERNPCLMMVKGL